MKKKDLEAELAASVQAHFDVSKERDELLAEVKAQSGVINKLQHAKKAPPTVADFSFDDLAEQMGLRIDAEIEACASDASRSWTLVSIRKGLAALGSK